MAYFPISVKLVKIVPTKVGLSDQHFLLPAKRFVPQANPRDWGTAGILVVGKQLIDKTAGIVRAVEEDQVGHQRACRVEDAVIGQLTIALSLVWDARFQKGDLIARQSQVTSRG